MIMTTLFPWLVLALAAVPAFLLARENWRYLVGTLVFLAPHTVTLLIFRDHLAALLADGLLRAAADGVLLFFYAAFIVTFVTHFILVSAPRRPHMFWVVPGQFFFVSIFFYLVYYLGRGAAGLFGIELSRGSIAAGVPLVITAVALLTTHRVRRVREQVPLAGLTAPLRVVQLSDIHVSHHMDDARLARLARDVNAEGADILVMTGDFVTLQSEHDYTPLLRFVAELERPPMGIFACLGNHDLGIAAPLTRDLEAAGVRMLRDAGETVTTPRGDAVRVAGLGFFWRRRRARYAAAFAQAAGEGDAPVLLLCHDPAAFDYLPADWRGIMFAGHLHGGQIGLTSLGLRLSVLTPLGMYDQGLYHRGEHWLYSHRGTGLYGFPARLGVPAEVAVLDLVPEAEADRRRVRSRPARPARASVSVSAAAPVELTGWRAVAARLFFSTREAAPAFEDDEG